MKKEGSIKIDEKNEKSVIKDKKVKLKSAYPKANANKFNRSVVKRKKFTYFSKEKQKEQQEYKEEHNNNIISNKIKHINEDDKVKDVYDGDPFVYNKGSKQRLKNTEELYNDHLYKVNEKRYNAFVEEILNLQNNNDDVFECANNCLKIIKTIDNKILDQIYDKDNRSVNDAKHIIQTILENIMNNNNIEKFNLEDNNKIKNLLINLTHKNFISETYNSKIDITKFDDFKKFLDSENGTIYKNENRTNDITKLRKLKKAEVLYSEYQKSNDEMSKNNIKKHKDRIIKNKQKTPIYSRFKIYNNKNYVKEHYSTHKDRNSVVDKLNKYILSQNQKLSNNLKYLKKKFTDEAIISYFTQTLEQINSVEKTINKYQNIIDKELQENFKQLKTKIIKLSLARYYDNDDILFFGLLNDQYGFFEIENFENINSLFELKKRFYDNYLQSFDKEEYLDVWISKLKDNCERNFYQQIEKQIKAWLELIEQGNDEINTEEYEQIFKTLVISYMKSKGYDGEYDILTFGDCCIFDNFSQEDINDIVQQAEENEYKKVINCIKDICKKDGIYKNKTYTEVIDQALKDKLDLMKYGNNREKFFLPKYQDNYENIITVLKVVKKNEFRIKKNELRLSFDKNLELINKVSEESIKNLLTNLTNENFLELLNFLTKEQINNFNFDFLIENFGNKVFLSNEEIDKEKDKLMIDFDIEDNIEDWKKKINNCFAMKKDSKREKNLKEDSNREKKLKEDANEIKWIFSIFNKYYDYNDVFTFKNNKININFNEMDSIDFEDEVNNDFNEMDSIDFEDEVNNDLTFEDLEKFYEDISAIECISIINMEANIFTDDQLNSFINVIKEFNFVKRHTQDAYVCLLYIMYEEIVKKENINIDKNVVLDYLHNLINEEDVKNFISYLRDNQDQLIQKIINSISIKPIIKERNEDKNNISSHSKSFNEFKEKDIKDNHIMVNNFINGVFDFAIKNKDKNNNKANKSKEKMNNSSISLNLSGFDEI